MRSRATATSPSSSAARTCFQAKCETVNGASLIVSRCRTKDIVVPLEGAQPRSRAAIASTWRCGVTTFICAAPVSATIDPDWNASDTRIRAIEYQGSFVKVMLDTIGEQEFVVYVPERQFFEDAFDVGRRRARHLEPRSVRGLLA